MAKSLSNKLMENILAAPDIENINLKEKDDKVIKDIKTISNKDYWTSEDFERAKELVDFVEYKIVDTGDSYELKRGDEQLFVTKKEHKNTDVDSNVIEDPKDLEKGEVKQVKESEKTEVDNLPNGGQPMEREGGEEVQTEDEETEFGSEDPADVSKNVKQETEMIPDNENIDEEPLEEGHTDDLIASVLALSKEKGKNWSEESLRKLSVPQLHVIEAKLKDPNFKTKKEKAAEEAKKNKEIEGQEEIKDVYEGYEEDSLGESMNIKGLSRLVYEGYTVFTKQKASGKYAYIIKENASKETISNNEAEDIPSVKNLVRKDLTELLK